MEWHSPETSYYRATAADVASWPALAGEATADVCVVGGGMTGVSAALHLAESGLSVVLLEADRIGSGASGRNGGQLITGLRKGIVELEARYGAAMAAELFAASLEAARVQQALVERHGIACDWHRGHFHAASKPAHWRDMAVELEAMQRHGYDKARLLDAREGRDIVDVAAYHGGLYDLGGGHFHTLNYTLGLAAAAARAGARLHEGSRVRKLEEDAAPRVITDKGSVRCRHVVLACDSYMERLAPELASHAMPVGNCVITTEPLDPALSRRLMPANAAVSDSRFVLNYFRLTADHRMMFSGGERYSPLPPADPAAFVRPHMLHLFPQLCDVRIDHAWSGLVSVTRSRLPHIGRKGEIFFAHGWSGQGAVLTTFAGKMLADAITATAGRFDLFARLPHRRFPGGRLLRTPLYVAAMLWFALRDRL